MTDDQNFFFYLTNWKILFLGTHLSHINKWNLERILCLQAMSSLYEFHLNCYHLETEKDRNDTMTNKHSIPPQLSNGEEVYKKNIFKISVVSKYLYTL